ncbi:MAG: M23 family metallopeptidase, partial [Proteobacteria bacterium]|nr:M23 family metallopeptidase [Pseudomonadota bacterium]
GERVKKGQIIATSGASGNVDTPQLHFELRQHASAVDPLRVLPRL